MDKALINLTLDVPFDTLKTGILTAHIRSKVQIQTSFFVIQKSFFYLTLQPTKSETSSFSPYI